MEISFLGFLAIVKWLELYRLASILACTFKSQSGENSQNVKCKLRLRIRLDRLWGTLKRRNIKSEQFNLTKEVTFKIREFSAPAVFYTRAEFAQNSNLTCIFYIHTFTYYCRRTVCIFYTNERPRSGVNFQASSVNWDCNFDGRCLINVTSRENFKWRNIKSEGTRVYTWFGSTLEIKFGTRIFFSKCFSQFATIFRRSLSKIQLIILRAYISTFGYFTRINVRGLSKTFKQRVQIEITNICR